VVVPLRLRQFKDLINNAYFTLPNGDFGKIESCRWTPSEDSATVTGWVRRPYTKNLKEIKYEPI